MVEISDSEEAPSEEALTVLERRIGLTLPTAYRQFLQRHNGGEPIPNVVDVPGLPGSPTDIQEFLGVGVHPVSSNIAWALEVMEETYPDRRLLPIARDSGGNLFCISFDTPEARPIHYVSFDSDEPYYELAPSFESFLAAIRNEVN